MYFSHAGIALMWLSLAQPSPVALGPHAAAWRTLPGPGPCAAACPWRTTACRRCAAAPHADGCGTPTGMRPSVVDDHVVAVGVQPGPACGAGDAVTDAHQVGDRFRRRVRQVDGVAFRDDQGVAAGERADIEEGQVVVVLVDPDGRSLTGDDRAEN